VAISKIAAATATRRRIHIPPNRIWCCRQTPPVAVQVAPADPRRATLY
jgi:hypothetical protein